MTYGVRMGPRPDAARWKNEKRILRKGPGTPYRAYQTMKFLVTRDRAAVKRLFVASYPGVSARQRAALLRGYIRTTNGVRGYHTMTELLEVTDHVLQLRGRPGLTVLELGAGSGSSTAKLSLATSLAGGALHVFDTFSGIPENNEQHFLLDGTPLTFSRGAFRGRLGAVKRRVAQFGAPQVCHFHKGLIEDTLKALSGPVDVALLDLDLIASTRVALEALLPRLRPGGAIFSQDGHLRATHALLQDRAFFEDLGMAQPEVVGVGGGKLLRITARPGGSQ